MKKNIPLDYANSLIYDLEKAFWDERGKGARFRTTNVGHAFFADKCLPLIKSSDIDHVLEVVKDVLVSEGIVSAISYEKEERLLRVSVEGYVHRPVDEKMVELGIEPFTCVPANLIVLAIEETLDKPVELAEIKLTEEAYHLLLVIFDQRPTLD